MIKQNYKQIFLHQNFDMKTKLFLLTYLSRGCFSKTIELNVKGKKILFFGIPGSGIGTFNTLLCKELGFNRISLTEELWKIKKGDDYHIFDPKLVDSVRNSLLIGRVSDNIFFRVLESKMKEKESEKGVSIDGFPRSWKQLEEFEKNYDLDLGINLIVDESIFIEGIFGRRICSNCHKGYNMCHIERNGYKLMPILPKTPGVCDECGTYLKQKPEDNIQTILARIEQYKKISANMINHIYKKYKIVEFSPKNGIDDFKILSRDVKVSLGFI